MRKAKPLDCDHYWSYVHTVYGGPGKTSVIRRYCTKCGIEEVGEVRKWRPPLKNEFDQSPEEAAEVVNA